MGGGRSGGGGGGGGVPTPERLSGWLRRQMRNGRSLADVAGWLRLPDVIEQLGAGRVAKHRKEIEKELRRTNAEACSGTRMDDWLTGREHYYAPGMKLTRVGSRDGTIWGGGLITPRWTPPQCVKLEDQLDGMTKLEADHYTPSDLSITAIQIQRIRAMKGHRVRKPRDDADRRDDHQPNDPPVIVSLRQTDDGPRLGYVPFTGGDD